MSTTMPRGRKCQRCGKELDHNDFKRNGLLASLCGNCEHAAKEEEAAAIAAKTAKAWAGQYGPLNPAMICPHCQAKGHMRTMQVKRKRGISGGKVMGGLLTGGVSLLATGLSQKDTVTQAFCGNCQSVWDF